MNESHSLPDYRHTSSVATLKKIKNPSWANKKPRKPKITFLYIWLKFQEKSYFSSKNSNFSRKNSILSAKIFDDLFLVINSLIFKFVPSFSNFQPFLALNLLLIPYFKALK